MHPTIHQIHCSVVYGLLALICVECLRCPWASQAEQSWGCPRNMKSQIRQTPCPHNLFWRRSFEKLTLLKKNSGAGSICLHPYSLCKQYIKKLIHVFKIPQTVVYTFIVYSITDRQIKDTLFHFPREFQKSVLTPYPPFANISK